jgi:hypothetical protein
MNHHPFREWLVMGEELSNEQNMALKQHLLDCESCREIQSSWKELEVEILRAPQVEPPAGFVVRWQANMVLHQQVLQRRKGWITIGATAMVVISLLVLLVIQIWSLLQAPDTFLATSFERLMAVLSIFFSFQNLAHSFYLPGPVYTLVGIVLLLGLISFMSVLWLATYRKISMSRREA